MGPGQLIAGRYRLEERVGSGGNGSVWRATDQELDRIVALKHALSQDSAQTGRRLARLRREARILARMHHPHIVTLFDVVADNGDWWLVMEYVSARTLRQHVPLAPDEAARLGTQLAGALEAVHAAGIVHRDVKPANVLVTDDDRAKLGDFGISRVVHGEVTLTGTALLAGTPGYVAPEVANGEEPTAASDMFSLGATLFAAVEGDSPVGSTENPLALLRRAAAGQFAEPRRSGPLVPVLSRLLALDPADRPTAAQARQLLENVSTGSTDRADAVPDVVPELGPEVVPEVGRPGLRHALRSRSAVAVLVVVGMVAVLGMALAAWPQVDSRPGTASGPDRSPAPRGSSIAADPRTADPCALVDPAPLARFGEVELDPHYGGFERCDVIVRNGDGEVDVRVELGTYDPEASLDGRVEKKGALRIVRGPGTGEECERTVQGRRDIAYVTAESDDASGIDLCDLADTATAKVVEVLSRNEIPRRTGPIARSSLLNVDACGLLDAAALRRFAGIDASRPDPGYAGWECRWSGSRDSGSLLIRFDKNQPLTAADGRPVRVGDRRAFVEPEGDGDRTCLVRVVHRRFTVAGSDPKVELMLVIVSSPLPSEQRCGLAVGLAESAAARLPPP